MTQVCSWLGFSIKTSSYSSYLIFLLFFLEFNDTTTIDIHCSTPQFRQLMSWYKNSLINLPSHKIFTSCLVLTNFNQLGHQIFKLRKSNDSPIPIRENEIVGIQCIAHLLIQSLTYFYVFKKSGILGFSKRQIRSFKTTSKHIQRGCLRFHFDIRNDF